MSGQILQAGAQMTQQQVANGNIPTISRAYTFQYTLVSGTAQQIDLRTLQNQSQFGNAQGIFVDNSNNTASCDITLPSGQTLVVPGQSQAMLPVYLPVGTPVLTISGSGIVLFVLVNFPVPAAVWPVAGSGITSVTDSVVAGLIQSAEGSVTGGTAATSSLDVAGIYTIVPALALGQQASVALTAQGGLKVASNGQSSSLGLTASTVVKATPGRVGKIIVNATTVGVTSILDATSAATVTAANTILSIPAGTVAGTILSLDVPALVGIAINVATSGTFSIFYD